MKGYSFMLHLLLIAVVIQPCKSALTFDLSSSTDSITLSWVRGGDTTTFTVYVDEIQVGQPHDASDSTTSKTMSGLESGTTHNVRVLDSTNRNVLYQSSIYTVPSAVTSFRKSSSTLDGIQLEWQPGSGERDQFIIEYNNIEGTPVQKEFPDDSASAEITGLVPGTTYNFTIKSVRVNKESDGVQIAADTDELQQVGSFEDLSSTETSINLWWRTGYYDVYHYKLTVTETSTGVLADTPPDIISEKNVGTLSYNVTGLKVATLYTVVIAMVSGEYSGPETVLGTNTNPAPPTGVQISTVDTTQLKAIWDELPGLTYKVTFRMDSEPEGSGASQSICVRSGCRFMVLGRPGTLWKVFVSALLNYKSSTAVSGLANTRPRMPGGLTKVEEGSNSTSITVQVTPASVMGIFDKYRVKIWNGGYADTKETTPRMIKDLERSADPLQVTFGTLIPGDAYTIGVSCVVEKVDNTESDLWSDIYITENVGPPAPAGLEDASDPAWITTLTVKVVGPETSVKIDRFLVSLWKGNYTGYPENDYSAQNSIPLTQASYETSFYGLEYRTAYTVCALSQVGWGTPLNSKPICDVFKTPKPTMLKSVQLTGPVGSSSVTILVEMPDLYEKIDQLRVRLWEGNNTAMPANAVVKNISLSQYPLQTTVDSLKGDTVYTVEAVSVLMSGDRILESDPVTVTFKTATSQEDQTCEAITIPLCSGIGYNMTSFPNLLGHTTQDEAGLDMHQFLPLVKVGCSPYLQHLLCSLYIPKCSEDQKQHMPCRSLCDNARYGCESLMNRFGFEWPATLNCIGFFEEEGCFDYHNDIFDWNSTLKVEEVEETSVRVSWNKPQLPILFFILSAIPQYNTSAAIVADLDSGVTEHTFVNLTVGTPYNITVKIEDASNRAVTGSVLVMTKGGPAIRSLTAVFEQDVNGGSAKIDFSIGNIDVHSTLKIQVVYTERTQPYTVDIVSGQYDYTVRKALLQGKCLEKICLTVEKGGSSIESKCSSRYIGPDTLPSLKAEVTDARALLLTWDRLPCADNFKVTCTSELHAQEVNPVLSSLPVTIEALFPGDKYTCTVTELKRDTLLATGEITAVIYPMHPKVKWDNSQQATDALTFLIDYDGNHTHIERYYLELYMGEEPQGEAVANFTTDSSTVSVHSFGHLTSGQTYTVHVYTESLDYTRSLTYSQVTATTKPLMTSVLQEVESSTTESNVTVSYTKSSGLFDNYKFSVHPGNSLTITKPHLKNDVRSEVTFVGLNPGVLYTVSGVTVIREVESDPVKIKVLTVPSPPKVTCGTTMSSVTVSVDQTETMATSDVSVVYIYSCVQSNGTVCGNSGATNSSSHMFENLQPDQEYTVTTMSRVSTEQNSEYYTKDSHPTTTKCYTSKDGLTSEQRARKNVGIGVGVTLAVLVVLAAVVLFVLMRKGMLPRCMFRGSNGGDQLGFSNNTYDVLHGGNNGADTVDLFENNDA